MTQLSLSTLANRAQQEAADPFISAWVSASAGSGKTKVLTDRVLQLLLAGNEPETILCLTFTKAAAAEMSNRLTKTLREWLVLEDSALEKKLIALCGNMESAQMTELRPFARTLFARVLDTKGGMKIMTIHSFCQSILKRFPLEAAISPAFEVLDETGAAELLRSAINQTLKNIAYSSELQVLSTYIDEGELLKLLTSIRSNQMELEHLLDEHMSLTGLKMKIYAALDVCENDTESKLIASVYQGDDFDAYKKSLLTQKEEPLKKLSPEKIPEAERLIAVLDKIKALKTAEATNAFLTIAFDVLQHFDTLKDQSGVLDYTDLILKTRALLEENQMAAWVLYKLDGGIDHILLDEAQDTSPNQWAIVRAIAEEFFAGEGRKSDKIRTVFAVGDKKQSIYRFQGADAHEFERMRQFFTKRIQESENEFKDIPLNISFRSTQAVLDLVNHLLRSEKARAGILRPDEDGTHFAFRNGQSGLVEVWPLEKNIKNENDTDIWRVYEPVENTQSAVKRLSIKIAARISKMLTEHEILESKNRPIRASDIMILVRSRDRQGIVGELVRALKNEGIPVAGVDRLILNKHIAVMDLIALGSFLLLPDDDLRLAEVLKSPLFGLSEEELFELAHSRGKNSLWAEVAAKRNDVYETLKDILSKVDNMPPFELFSYILDTLGMRQKFLKRLGQETNEMLDEFLNLALSFEQNHSISLQNFLHFIKKDDIEIKRDLDNSEINAVRIMTVHGSKGLQSNIVFLPDAYSKIKKTPNFIWKDKLPVWIPNADVRSASCQDVLKRLAHDEDDEYNRLLYVALTRAQDRLYICGFETGKKAPEGNWYDLIATAIPSFDSEKGARISCPQTGAPEKEKKSTASVESLKTLPAWFNQKAPEEPTPTKPLSPSRLTEEPAAPSPLTPEQEKAMLRGTFIHKLLQHLPDIAPDMRQTFIERICPKELDLPVDLLQLFDKPEMQALFGKSSMPEVPIIGTASNGLIISGQIDRLVVTQTEVLIIDYKTNRYPPKNNSEVPVAYIEQMNAYKDLLKNIFNGKKIRCFLLWTTTLTLMEI